MRSGLSYIPLAELQDPGSYTVVLTHEQKTRMARGAVVLVASIFLAGVIVGHMVRGK